MNIGLQKKKKNTHTGTSHNVKDAQMNETQSGKGAQIEFTERIQPGRPNLNSSPDARPLNLRRDRIVPIASRLHKESEMAKHSQMKYSCHL